jgi:hypothetical protein
MPNTYVALRQETVTGSAASSITFSLTGITGYTDLIIVGQYGSTASEDYLRMAFNSDTTTNYSETRINGTGTSAQSTGTANQNYMFIDWNSSCENALTKMARINIMNYANTTTFKNVLIRGDRATPPASIYTGTEAMIGSWRKTPEAITSIVLTMQSGSIAIGSTFSLYGVANADNFAKATGGIVAEDSTYWYHVFGASGTFTPKQSLTCDYIVVAGGGGGGGGTGGGGGAGGFYSTTGASLSTTAYTVTIGAGGTGGSYNSGSGGYRGSNGSNSSFNSITRTGGGGGGTSPAPNNLFPGSGGSGGGGARSGQSQPGASGNAGSYSPVEGYAGGSNSTSSLFGAGGGGGAGAAGANGTTTADGAGGIGATSSLITAIVNATTIGQLVSGVGYIAGGGGSSSSATSTGAEGGYGGGGKGASTSVTAETAGQQNTGSGGGGRYLDTGVAASGGSGVVIIRYAKA